LILEQVQQTNKQSFKKTITIKQSPLVYLSKKLSSANGMTRVVFLVARQGFIQWTSSFTEFASPHVQIS